jgi:hypothetical protein
MIRTNTVVSNISEIPPEWIFEKYLQLPEKLIGQEVKIKSPLNPNENNPSFTLFFDKNKKYFFKDFSSGKGGSATELVQLLFPEMSKAHVLQMIKRDYESAKGFLTSTREQHKQFSKFVVSTFHLRKWNTYDAKYWGKYQIGSGLLEKYNIAALEYFEMTKIENEVPKIIRIERDNIYGYFKNDGTLAKIYQPFVKEAKFIKVCDYIQGSNQLTFKEPNLLIVSSLKDGLAFMRLGIPGYEFCAPDSENTIIPERHINQYKSKYQKIQILFDNDDAGKAAAQVYGDRYGLRFVNLDMDVKDVSDAVEQHGVEKVKKELTKLLLS